MIHHILMAYDFSPTSTLALDEAIALAQKLQARLDLLHVIPYNEVSRLVDLIPHLDQVENKIRDNVEGEFKKIQGNYPHQAFTTHIRIGSPAKEIVQFAEAGPYDLIIVGSHGRTGLKRFFLGSIAESVLRHSRLPVFINREFSATGLKRLLIPIDLSPSSERALRQGLAWSQLFDAEMSVMHVLGEPYYLPLYIQEDPEAFGGLVGEYEEKEKSALKNLVNRIDWHGRSPEILFKTDTDPAHAIIETAKEKKCDLIILGSHGRTGLEHILLGSVAEKVVRYAPSSVLTVNVPKEKI